MAIRLEVVKDDRLRLAVLRKNIAPSYVVLPNEMAQVNTILKGPEGRFIVVGVVNGDAWEVAVVALKPPRMVDHFQSIRLAMDLGPPTFHQEVLADFMGEGHFARHIRRMRVLYRERRSAFVDSISKELGSMAEVHGGDAGMHLAVKLPAGSRDVDISERAARQDLWVWPLSPFYLGEAPRPGFILGFGSTPAEEIPLAGRKLRNLIDTK